MKVKIYGRMAKTRRKQEQALAELLNRSIKAGEQRGLERALLSAASYVLGREVDDAARELARRGVTVALRALAIAARETWPSRWREALSGPLSAVMESATEGAAPVLGSFTLQNPVMREYLDGYTSELGKTLSGTSYDEFERTLRGALNDGLSVPNTVKLLRDRLPELNKSRAELIARTETIRASNGASLEQARRSGVVKNKVWLSAKDNRVRPEHRALDGVEVPVNEPFPNGLQAPGEPRCRCTLTFTIDTDALRGRLA